MWVKQQILLSRSKRNDLIENEDEFNDPKWPMMWYLVSSSTTYYFVLVCTF